MDKPNQPRLRLDAPFDYDLAQRATRQLQDTSLHVYATYVMAALPKALETGGPDDAYASLMVPLTMITDGRRGWLVLVDEQREYDAPAEMTELLDEVVGAAGRGHYVVRGACMRTSAPVVTRRTLRLADPSRVRSEIERAYAEAVGRDGPPIDHDVLLGSLRAFGYCSRDERELRSEIAQLDGTFGRASLGG